MVNGSWFIAATHKQHPMNHEQPEHRDPLSAIPLIPTLHRLLFSILPCLPLATLHLLLKLAVPHQCSF